MPDWVSPAILINVELRLYDFGRDKARKVLQPKTSFLAMRISELVWVYILRRLFVHRRDNPDWVFKANAINVALEKAFEKI
jgi:hypothetical protein